MLAVGTTLGPYKILAPLGAGGMGEVYRARDHRLGRDVALKVIPSELARDPERIKRFEQEARAAGALNHPNIVAIHDIGSHEGAPFVVMELLEGESLRSRLGQGPLPVRKALDYAVQAAHGLAAAYEKGIVHRDLKPENLFLTRDGRVKVLDFGLAKLTRPDVLAPAGEKPDSVSPTATGVILGTVGYMAPEQVRGQAADHRSDLFALGAILYEMLTGERAFRGASFVDTLSAILKEEPPPLAASGRDIPPALEPIVRHCLEKRPEERFQSARDLAFALEGLSGAAVETTTGMAAAGPVTKPGRGLGLITVAILAGAAVVIGFALGTIRQARIMRGASRPVYQRLTVQRGEIKSARFSPDGKTVFYSAEWEGRPSEIFETRPGSLTARAMGLSAVCLASVSGRGTMAVTLGQSGTVFRPQLGTLAEAPISGGAPRRILDDVWGADWSPDGKTLAVVRQVGSRVRLEMPPGRVLYQSAGGLAFARVAPSGRWLAFADNPVPPDMRGSVVITDSAERVTARTDEWNFVGGVAWSADGREAWFCASQDNATTEIRAMSPDGRQRVVERLPGWAGLYDIGQDGRVLLSSTRTPAGVRGRRATDKEERELGWLDLPFVTDISADGSTILFDEEGLGGGPLYSVYVRSMDGAAPAKLGEGHACSLSPDGRWALAIHFGPPHRLLLLPTGVGDSTSLPRGGIERYYAAGWLADGKRVVFVGSERGRARRTYVQEVARGLPRPITPEALEGVVTSPDGRFVAAISVDRRIHLCPIDGGELRVIGESPQGEVILRWSADGRSLLVGTTTGRTTVISRLDLRTGTRTLWKTLAAPVTAGASVYPILCITPDGRSYAYNYVNKLDELYVVEGLK
jgi:Tol biopolymer transport system component